MFLELNHNQLPVYLATKKISVIYQKATKFFPVEEKYNLTQQIRSDTISTHLNADDALPRKSEAEKKSFYEIGRSSVIEINAALDISKTINYCSKEELFNLGEAKKIVKATYWINQCLVKTIVL